MKISLLMLALASGGARTFADAQVPQSDFQPTSVPASSPRTGSCPGGNGIRISLDSGDSAGGINRVIDETRSTDTTIVFNVAERSWSRTNLAATISAGLADETQGRYMICAGVTALMPSATLTVRGARGRLHFQASLADLTSAIRLAPGATSPPPRRL